MLWLILWLLGVFLLPAIYFVRLFV
jgi:hypothetical protein